MRKGIKLMVYSYYVFFGYVPQISIEIFSLELLHLICLSPRYTWLGNMTGLPAVQVPMCWYQMVNTDPSEEPQTSEGEKIKTDGTDYVGIKGDTDIPCSIQVN